MLATSGDEPKPQSSLLAGRYELGERLGSGGLATVHRGRRIGPAGFARPVAIKRLHPHWSRHADAVMFLDEARIASCIVHPNVVATLDVVSEAGEYAVVMELVEGATLEQLVSGGAPPRAITVRLVADVLRGLHAAHEARDTNGEALGVVHRDVAPSNILVGRDGVARIGDFGVAKARGRLAATRNGEVKGHLSYMAPEQLVGDEVDPRADVFGAGVVLWEALTGRRLFHGENEAQVIFAVLERPIPSPRAIDGAIPIALDAIALRALAHEAKDRFPSARAMAEALEGAGEIASREEVASWVAAHGALGDSALQQPAADTWLDAPRPHAPKRRRTMGAAIALAMIVVAAMVLTLRRSPASAAFAPSASTSTSGSTDVAVRAPAAPSADVTSTSAEVAIPVAPSGSTSTPVVGVPARRTKRPQTSHPAPHRATPVRLYARD